MANSLQLLARPNSSPLAYGVRWDYGMMKTNCAFQIKMLTLRFTGDGALDSVPATALLIRGMPEVLRVRVDAEHRELEVLYQDSTDNNDLGWTILRNTLPEDYKITDVNEN